LISNKDSFYKRLNELVIIIFMTKISEIDLPSALLSTFILLGFIATAFVFIRLTIIGVNYIKVNFSKEEGEENIDKNKESQTKGF